MGETRVSEDSLGFFVPGEDEYWKSWSVLVRERAPRLVADRVEFVYKDDSGSFHIFWSNKTVTTLSYSDKFPTELDIARLCVECP